MVVVDTRVEAQVQRDENGPVGTGAAVQRYPSASTSASSSRSSPTSRLNNHNSSGSSSNNVRRSVVNSAAAPERVTYGGVCAGQPKVVAEWSALRNCVFDVQWMLRDSVLALGCADNTCRLQDTETQKEVPCSVFFCRACFVEFNRFFTFFFSILCVFLVPLIETASY